jgi:exodeoxyribonuclease VII large subunit
MASLLHRAQQKLDDLGFRMESALRHRLGRGQREVNDLTAAVLRHDPRRQLAHARGRCDAYRSRLDRTLERMLEARRGRLAALDAHLNSLSPLAVLDRGYALVLDAKGVLVRSTRQVALEDSVVTRLSDGAFASRVTEIREQRTGNRE